MKRWVIEIEIETEDSVSEKDMSALARKIEDDTVMRVGNEIEGDSEVFLGDVQLV